MKAFRKRILTMLVSLELREATTVTVGQDLLPHAPTEEELLTIWERFAAKDQFVLETLLQILKLVRYPIDRRDGCHLPKGRSDAEGARSGLVPAPPSSPAVSILLKVIFSAQSSRALIEQALVALKFQFANELDGFLKCVEHHGGLRPDTITRSMPDFTRRCLMVYGFVVTHVHDSSKLKDLLGPRFPRVKVNTTDNTNLTALLIHCLQSAYVDIRRKAIEIIGNLCLCSEDLATRCFPLFDRALSRDVESIRIEALKIMSDLCFLYPSLNAIEFACNVHLESAEPVHATYPQIVLEFLTAPSKELQFIATIAVARFLQHIETTDELEPEKMLLALLDKYFAAYDEVADIMSLEEHQQLMELIYIFFEKYTDAKSSHQREMANAVVLLVIEALYDQVIPTGIFNPNPEERYNRLFSLQPDNQEAETESEGFAMFKRKARFLLSFIDPSLISPIISSLQHNAVVSFQTDMTREEAIAILDL